MFLVGHWMFSLFQYPTANKECPNFKARANNFGFRFRDFAPGIAEMKRMFVLPAFQGRGVGKALTGAFLETAREMGYRSVRLDSIRELDKALRLYQNLGFKEIEPYRFNPHPEAVFMEYFL